MFRKEGTWKEWLPVLTSLLLVAGACGGGAETGASASSVDGTGGGAEKPTSGTDAGSTSPDGGASWVDAGLQDWSCLDNPEWARADRAELEYTGKAVAAVGGEPMAGVEFEVCPDASDASCANPVVEGETGTDGTFTGTISTGEDRLGFDGYARVKGDDVVDTLVFFHPPITENKDAPDRAPLVTRDLFETFATAGMGKSPNPERGHLALEALDCSWSRAGGVTFEIDTGDAETTEAYLRGGTTPDATAERTDGSGLGGFVDVPPGEVTVTARVAETGEYVGEVDVFVEAGAVSEVAVAPTPSSQVP